jgi:hypothetical protein
MYWADSIGAERIHAKLSEWERKLGQFFRPCSYLSERAAAGVPLVRTVSGIVRLPFFRNPTSALPRRFHTCFLTIFVVLVMIFICRVLQQARPRLGSELDHESNHVF